MSKIRINSRFGVIPNSLLTHKEITLRAKGLYGYIQSKPDGWDFSSERIAYETKDGRDSIREGLKELEAFGYLDRVKVSLGRGSWDIEYTLYDIPQERAKKDELSRTEIPSSIHDTDAKLSGTEFTTTINPSTNKKVNTKKEIDIKKEYILAFWNDQKIIEHKKLTPSIEKQIEKVLKSFSEDDIKKAIKNFSAVFHSPRTWWSYRWTLAEFLKRENGFEVFLEKGEKDYLTDKSGPFVDKAAEIQKSQDAEKRALDQKKKEESQKRDDKKKQDQIIRWYESTPEGLRAQIDKEISEDFLVKGLKYPVLPDLEKNIAGDPPSEVERKKLVISSTIRMATLKIASKYMQK